MGRKYSEKNEQAFLIGLAVLFIVLTFFVIYDIVALLIYAAILSYFLYPLYTYFLEKFQSERLASVSALVTVTLGFIIPFALLAYFLILNLLKLVVQYKELIENPEILNIHISSFLESLTHSTTLSSIDYSSLVEKVVVLAVDIVENFFSSLPKTIIYFFIVLFISYYILIYNKSLFKIFNDYIPISMARQNAILRNIQKNLNVLFRGYFLTGLIQTAVAFLGYLVFGAPNILIITFITLITSLIPYIGTPLVWVPVGLFMVVSGSTFGGVGLLIYGTFIISVVDNFLRPHLMSDKETISPPLVFVGFIGGTFAFGLIGIVVGPIIISITSILLQYVKEYFELKE
ncbi:AI-2E family transporter [Candidatus Woesearchaeota archaeon]|nr:AI-2E family transporter [Nanoarchaeota archaeon]MCB9370618.1 AI-2E family transporter [Candidatus Woesearchaeota archaeon]USN43702.1 MAG: AI-2E family transporter [Candidatus Woesearchaeota archaeon]